MKRIIILLFVTLSLAAISAPADSVQKTVTLTQEQLDQLLQDAAEADQYKYIVQEAVKEATDQLRSEMESRYNTYVTHVGNNMTLYTGFLGVFGVFLTILIAIAGILVPVLINRRFEKSIEEKIQEQNTHIKENIEAQSKDIQEKINDHDETIKQSEKRIDELSKELLKAKKDAEDSAKEAKLSALFSQAYNEDDLNKKIRLYTKLIKITTDDGNETPTIIQYLAKAYNNRANTYRKIGNLDQALTDANTAIKNNSQRATYFDTRADIYVAMADKETDKAKAKEYYQKALDDCMMGLSLGSNERIKKLLEEKKQLCEEKLRN